MLSKIKLKVVTILRKTSNFSHLFIEPLFYKDIVEYNKRST